MHLWSCNEWCFKLAESLESWASSLSHLLYPFYGRYIWVALAYTLWECSEQSGSKVELIFLVRIYKSFNSYGYFSNLTLTYLSRM